MDSDRVLPKLAVAALLLAAAGVAQAQLYWRVDLGASFSTGADIQDSNFSVDQVICGDAACTVPGKIEDIGTSGILSGGMGWRFSPNLRVDGTISYRGQYNISDTMPDATTLKADVHSWSFMANGYYDFALTWGKPYVGAGIGWAQNRVDDLSITNSGITLVKHGGTRSGFAWAVMAGVGVPVSPALTLDVAVRYTDLGEIQVDPGGVAAGGTTVGVYGGAQGKLKAWELTVGLRF